MQTVSIGFYREDGDFAILATLNNNDGYIADGTFAYLVEQTRAQLAKFTASTQIVAIERQDAPDYTTID
jgi:hypothetical protein